METRSLKTTLLVQVVSSPFFPEKGHWEQILAFGSISLFRKGLDIQEANRKSQTLSPLRGLLYHKTHRYIKPSGNKDIAEYQNIKCCTQGLSSESRMHTKVCNISIRLKPIFLRLKPVLVVGSVCS